MWPVRPISMVKITVRKHTIPNALLAVAGRRPPMEIYGTDYPTPDGTAIRDYVHVEDLIEAHLAGLERSNQFGPFNLGTTTGASVAEVIASVEAVTDREVPRTYRLGGQAIPRYWLPTHRKLGKLGWTPTARHSSR